MILRIFFSTRSSEICYIVFHDHELITEHKTLIWEPFLGDSVAQHSLKMLNETSIPIFITEKERREMAHISDEVLFFAI